MENAVFRLLHLPQQPDHHAHTHHQIVLGLDGYAELEIQGRAGRIGPNQGCIVSSEHTHYFCGEHGNRCIVIDIPKQLSHNQYGEWAPLCADSHYFEVDDSLRHFLVFAAMELNLRNDSELLMPQIMQMLASCIRSRLALPLPSKQRIDLQKLNQYLQGELANRPSVATLAKLFNCSESHFYSLFRGQTGQSPHQYLLEFRLQSAAHWLKHERLSLADIAERCGFANQSAMTLAIKKRFQLSPKQLRQLGNTGLISQS